MAYLIADKLGSIQEDGLPAPAPYSTNLLIDEVLNHKLDASALRENPKGLAQFFAEGTVIKIADKANLHGVICSPLEIKIIKKIRFFLFL